MYDFLRKPEQVNSELTLFFKENGFDVNWDRDRYYEWIEIYENGKLVMQIESKVTVDQFIDLLIKDYKARQEGVFINPDFFVASDIFQDDDKCLEFCNKFEEFRKRISEMSVV